MIDFAHPAFIRSNVLRVAGRVLVSAVHVNNGVIHQGACVSEYRSAGNRRSLKPVILLCVVHLYVVDGVVVRPSTDQVNIAIVAHTGHSIVKVFGRQQVEALEYPGAGEDEDQLLHPGGDLDPVPAGGEVVDDLGLVDVE